MLVRTLAAAALAAAALATPAAAGTESHTICHRVEEKAPWLVYCHD